MPYIMLKSYSNFHWSKIFYYINPKKRWSKRCHLNSWHPHHLYFCCTLLVAVDFCHCLTMRVEAKILKLCFASWHSPKRGIVDIFCLKKSPWQTQDPLEKMCHLVGMETLQFPWGGQASGGHNGERFLYICFDASNVWTPINCIDSERGVFL